MVKLVFLKCIFQFVIKIASPTLSNVKDRQIWFKLNNFTCSFTDWQRRPSGIGVVRYQLVVMLQVRIMVARNFFLCCRFFFFFVLFNFLFIIFFPFPFFLYSYCWPSIVSRGFCNNVFLVWIGTLFLWLAQW